MVQEKQRERATNRETGGERSEKNRWCKRNRGREQQTERQEKQGEREVRKIDGARETGPGQKPGRTKAPWSEALWPKARLVKSPMVKSPMVKSPVGQKPQQTNI